MGNRGVITEATRLGTRVTISLQWSLRMALQRQCGSLNDTHD